MQECSESDTLYRSQILSHILVNCSYAYLRKCIQFELGLLGTSKKVVAIYKHQFDEILIFNMESYGSERIAEFFSKVLLQLITEVASSMNSFVEHGYNSCCLGQHGNWSCIEFVSLSCLGRVWKKVSHQKLFFISPPAHMYRGTGSDKDHQKSRQIVFCICKCNLSGLLFCLWLNE